MMPSISELPPTSTLDRLPEILGISPDEVVRGLKHRRDLFYSKLLGNIRESASTPQAVIYKVPACEERLRARPIPAKAPEPTELFAKKERVRRLRALSDSMFSLHGISLRHALDRSKAKGWQIALERGSWHALAEGMPPTLIGAYFVLPDIDEDVQRYLAYDQTAYLPILMERIRGIAKELMPAIDDEVAKAVETWRRRSSSEAATDAARAARHAVISERMANGLFFIAHKMNRIDAAILHQLDEVQEAGLDKAKEIEARIELQRRTGFDRYPNLFPVARSMKRRLTLLVGPTNSGKTHRALELVSEASSSQVLSPLRLLALEHRDAMNARGLRSGLVTGEERVDQDAPHVARTIETVDLGRRTEIAVIDEIQMLDDRARGWAWTQALFGVPADHVVLTGSPTAIPVVSRIAEELGEDLTIERFERKNELHLLPDKVSIANLQSGDAVLAFTRSDIHDLRVAIRAAGRSVATIYGALGPEVRRSEAERFRSGEAEVLVATDAIGMGLNLPIRRVLFSTTEKFNGIGRAPIDAASILQMAGRAGRYGHFEDGFVGVLKGERSGPDLHRLRNCLALGAKDLSGRAYVRPNLDAIRMTAAIFETDLLHPVLSHLAKNLVKEHPALRMADLAEELQKASRLDRLALPLEVRYGYAIAPVNLRSQMQLDRMLAWAAQHAKNDVVEPYEGVRADNGLESLESAAQTCVAWLWLAQRFPHVYRDQEQVRATRDALNAAIENRLATTSSAKQAKNKSSPATSISHHDTQGPRR